MGVHHSDEKHHSYLRPIQPPIRFVRKRVMRRHEQQPVRPVEIDGELSGTIALQLMAPPRQIPHYLQRSRSPEVVKTPPYQLRSLQIVSSHEALGVIPVLRIIADWELYLHLSNRGY